MARGEHELPAGTAWLTPREYARASSMRFTKRRTEYLLRRWVGKQAVAAAAGLLGDEGTLARVEVANHIGGAPYVLLDGEPLGLDVSLTDRAGWAVCLLGSDLSHVGCDLEVVETRSAGFVSDFLTETEQRWVAAHPPGDARDCAANLLWSAKESALKVLQTGLRRDTRSVEVEVPVEAEGTAFDGAATGWRALAFSTPEGHPLCGLWRREGVFVLTVAAQSPVAAPEPLAGCADLATATPVHSWVGRPTAAQWPVAPSTVPPTSP